MTTEDRAARLLGSVREGWHGLAGGDARSCPGCPVCSLTHQAGQAGRLDPATTEHLQAAAGHLLAAGRELLAVLGAGHAPGPTTGPAGEGDAPHPAADAAAGPVDPADPAVDPAADPAPVARPAGGWTKIPVSTPQTDEEHP